MSNSLDLDQAWDQAQNYNKPGLGPNCLQKFTSNYNIIFHVATFAFARSIQMEFSGVFFEEEVNFEEKKSRQQIHRMHRI